MNPLGPRIVAAARGWIGTPYRHQASARGIGTDCLGLLRGIWRDVIGPEPEPVPPYTADWSEAAGREELLVAACRWLRPGRPGGPHPGDVLIFRMRDGAVAKHLGLMAEIGPDQSFIHAYAGLSVVESPLSAPWARRIVAYHSYPDGVS